MITIVAYDFVYNIVLCKIWFRILLHLDKFIQFIRVIIQDFNVLLNLWNLSVINGTNDTVNQDIATFDASFSLLQSCSAAPPRCMFLILLTI